MKRTILSLLVAGMFAGAGTMAIAQNVTADDEPAATSQTNPSTDSSAGQAKSEDGPGTNAGNQAKSGDDYNAATTKAQATFTEANAKCDSLQGAEKTTCVSDAESARAESLAEAEKEWNSQNDKQSKNEAGDQTEAQDGMTKPEDSAATDTEDSQKPDQTGQAETDDGATVSDDRAEANPDQQDPDRTAATESAAPNSAELGEVNEN